MVHSKLILRARATLWVESTRSDFYAKRLGELLSISWPLRDQLQFPLTWITCLLCGPGGPSCFFFPTLYSLDGESAVWDHIPSHPQGIPQCKCKGNVVLRMWL